MNKPSAFFQNLILSLVTLLCLAGIAELALRGYYARHYRGVNAVCLQGDEELIYRLKPDSVLCGTNSQGYMDKEYPWEKRGRRIVVIGDSVAAGQGVPAGRSFAKLLEKKLNRSPEADWEVIVLAVPGYSTGQEIVLLKKEAFRYQPDLLLIAYHLNDPAHPLYHNADGQVAMYFYRPRSYTFFYLKRLIFRARSTLVSWKNHCPDKPWCLYLHCVYWPDVIRSFQEITAMADRHQTPVVFAFLPLLLDADQTAGRAQLYERLMALARKNGAGAVDLMRPFAAYSDGVAAFRLPGDPWHPNEQGHLIMADSLYHYLSENHYLDPVPHAPVAP